MSALRTAGRGATLRQSSAPTTRLPSQFPARSAGMGRGNGLPSRGSAPHAGEGRGGRLSRLERSALSHSVLQRGETGNRRGRERKSGSMDWFSSPERLEALEQFQVNGGVGDERAGRAAGVPFGWRDFDEGLRELPEEHWAAPFVREVVRSVEMNPGLEGRVKEEVLDRTLKELSRLSMGEERFQDAEQ